MTFSSKIFKLGQFSMLLSLFLFSLTFVQAMEVVRPKTSKVKVDDVKATTVPEVVIVQAPEPSTEVRSPKDVKAEKLALLETMISAYESIDMSNVDKFKKKIYPEMQKICQEHNIQLSDVLASPQISKESQNKIRLLAKLTNKNKNTPTTKTQVIVKKNWEEACPWNLNPVLRTCNLYEFSKELKDFFEQAYDKTIYSSQVRFENVIEGNVPGTLVGIKPYIEKENEKGERTKIYYGLEGTDPDEVIERMGIIGEVVTNEKSKNKEKMVTTKEVGGFFSGEKLVSLKDGKVEIVKGRKMIEAITFRPFKIAEIKNKKRQEVVKSLLQAIKTNDSLKAKRLLEELPVELSISKVENEIQKVDQTIEEQAKILMTKMDERQNLAEKFLEAWQNSNVSTEVEKYKLLSVVIKKLLQDIEPSADVSDFLNLASISKNKESGNNLLSNAILSGDKDMVKILMKKYPLLLTDDDLRFNIKNDTARDLAKAALLNVKKEQSTNSAEIINRREIAILLDEHYTSNKLYFKDLEHIKDITPRDFTKMQALLAEIESAISSKKIAEANKSETVLIDEVQKMISDENNRIQEISVAQKDISQMYIKNNYDSDYSIENIRKFIFNGAPIKERVDAVRLLTNAKKHFSVNDILAITIPEQVQVLEMYINSGYDLSTYTVRRIAEMIFSGAPIKERMDAVRLLTNAKKHFSVGDILSVK
ncbi:MAG: hypothetical protein HQK51_07215 [Oligoflexia bacterium]|nr:hypothetical protein [Oligoflexia bacterium]